MKPSWAAVVGGFFVVAAVAYLLGANSVEPVQRRPPPSERTAIVTRSVIREVYTFSGRLVEASPARPLADEGIVTAMPVKPGATVRSGTVILEVNGRPRIALDLAFPLWRDLQLGMSGKDVLEVQEALRGHSYYGGPLDGRFNAALELAVRSLYERLGYQPEVSRAARRTKDDSAESTRRVSLPRAEIVALIGGPLRLRLGDTRVGDALESSRAALAAVGTRLEVRDGGKLARILRRRDSRRLSLFVGDDSAPTVVRTRSSAESRGRSAVVLERRSGLPPRGEVTGNVVIRTTKSRVTAVPVTALTPTPDGRVIVRVREDGRTREVRVKVGLRGDRLVEVRGEGLAPGMSVLLP